MFPGAGRILSSTILLQAADEGGDFQFRDQTVSLNPGEGIVFPSGTEHQVTMVSKGTRYSLVRWLSGVKDEMPVEKGKDMDDVEQVGGETPGI